MPSHSGVEHDLFEPPPPPGAYAQSEATEAAAVDLSDAALSERPPRHDSAPPLFDLTHTGPTKATAPQEDIDFLLGLQGSRGTTAALQNPTLADLAKKPPSEPPPLPIEVEIPVAETEPELTPAPAKRERTPPNAPSLAAVASQTAPPSRAPAIATPPPKPRKRSAALIAVAALGLSGAVLASTMLTRQPTAEAPPPPTTDRAEPAVPARNARPGLPDSAETTSPQESPPDDSVAPPASRAPKAPSRTGVPSAKQPSEKATAPSTLAPRPEPARPEPARVEPVRPPPVTPRPSAPRAPVGAGFDRQAAINALTTQASQASSCRKGEDPSGTATVVITFAPSGRVTSANVSGPPFAGTPTGGCIAAAFRRARVPEFDGDNVTVSKTVVIH